MSFLLDVKRRSWSVIVLSGVSDMLPPSSLKPSAPSTSLLRFLRSQSDSVQLLTCSPRQKSPSYNRSSRRTSSTSRDQNWTHLPCAPCQARLDSGVSSVPSVRVKHPNNTSRCRPSLRQDYNANLLLASPAKLSRSSSTKSRPLLRRLLDYKRNRNATKSEKKSQPPANNGPFLEDGMGSPFNIGRTLAGKTTNELRLRCTEFDNTGNVTLVNGEFKKSELIAKVRDYR